MKRMLLRLSALTAVVVLGLIAIAQAQRSLPPSEPGADVSAPRSNVLRGNSAGDGGRFVMEEPARFNPGPARRLPPADVVVSDQIEDAPVRQTAGARELSAARPEDGPGPDPFNLGNRAPATQGRFGSPAAPAQLQPDTSAEPAKLFDPARPSSNDAAAPATGDSKPTEGPKLLLRVPQNNETAGSPTDGEPSRTVSVMHHHPAVNSALRPVDAVSTPAEAVAAIEGAGRPGAKQLEGSQSPRLTVEKIAPREAQVGKTARFEIKVVNVGEVAAQGVEVHDCVPQGAQLIGTNPPANQGTHGELSWTLGMLKPGEQASVQMDLSPTSEGEIGSVATVTFRTDASARTVATKPQLTLELVAPKQVLIGENVKLSIKLSNPGTGVASGVVISERVPNGLQHPAGSEVEFEIGSLKPGESRQVDLVLKASQAGHIVNSLSARGEGNLKAEQHSDIEVVAPALSVAMTGPAKRYLERQATYTVSVSNPGTAPAKDVQLVTQLPRGMKFVKANNSGHFDPNTNTVSWSLEELPASETGSVTLVAMPIEAGEQKVRVQGKAQQGLTDEKEQTVTVEGLAALAFDVRASDETIEIGGETTYAIHIVNQGSKAASNVRVTVALPAELKATGADGPARDNTQDHQVQFEPIARLEPKGEAMFHVKAQALQAGDLRVKVQLLTDDMRQPLTKEESTRVYADQ